MALFNATIFSERLGMNMPISVIIPEKVTRKLGTQEVPEGEYPVLWLLHGLSGDHSVWLTQTRIDYYANEYGIAVVMPAAHRSFYQNTLSGLNYFNYISEELPEICRRYFHFSSKKELNFIAGNSMGGYGAIRCALWKHDCYAAAYSFSGVLDIQSLRNQHIISDSELRSLFSEQAMYADSEANLLNLATEHSTQNIDLPRMYGCCGTEDYLLQDSKVFAAHMAKIGLPFEYLENEGDHSWNYWSGHLEYAIKKLIGIS